MSEPGSPGSTAGPGRRARPARSAKQSLGQIVLGFEFVVVFLGALVAFGLHAAPPVVALGGGGALAVITVVTVGLLRYRWGFAIGWAVQVAVIASGFLVGAMFIVGAIFTGMWAYAVITGERLDRTTHHFTSTTDETEHHE